ncbi:DUF881 domain-containing protein [Streptomyces zingiberis]|uniref:DUF881 domain-containing protein n=1 Tax=Streptomyces zingiberis TaxID=2053010 RepID=A0ABX1BNG3_9ACTN|nr:DUF881 domain-containing protein [Streptomyces zingiberis]NJP99255.1 DUF881 domain-containing protein [Streptomyces zingiberis]
MSNPADPAPEPHGPAPRRSGPRPARLLTAGVFALAGLLFWTSFDTAQGTNLRTDDSLLELSDLIGERSRENARLDEETAAVRSEVDRLAQRDDGSTKAQDRALKGLERDAGTAEVGGPGLTVTLTDAPPDATARTPGIPDPQPNDLVIHQQDLQAVVNALWAGGARGIRVMDQRLISTSAVRCVGNTLILQGRVYSPPYVVTAVGDTAGLQRALDDSPDIENYLRYVDAYGLGWKVEKHGAVTLPGHSGTVDLQHATPVDGPESG